MSLRKILLAVSLVAFAAGVHAGEQKAPETKPATPGVTDPMKPVTPAVADPMKPAMPGAAHSAAQPGSSSALGSAQSAPHEPGKPGEMKPATAPGGCDNPKK